jgi:hypothetical protein
VSQHADDVVLSDHADGRTVPADVAAHADACPQCRGRVQAFRDIREAAWHERLRTYETPDIWPALASLTVHRAMVRRTVLRDLWRPFVLWLLMAFLLGVVATESFRAASRQIAATSNRVAPTPDGTGAGGALRTLEGVDERR